MKSPKVHILLSTYNGAKYIEEQLKSIFEQTYQNFTLFVRDDGSSDNTVEILKSFIKEYEITSDKIIILPNEQNINIGWKSSFWMLMDKCGGADYYAFADQDDVWLPEKLEYAVEKIRKENVEIPTFYFSQYYYCDENLNKLHLAPTPTLPIAFKDVMFYTPAFGFSMVINECLRNKALETNERDGLVHDGWLQKIAAALGKIIYDERCTALYRRHSGAVTFSNVNLIATLRYWLKEEILVSNMREFTHFHLNRFYEVYKTDLNGEDLKLLELYVYETKSASRWIKRVFCNKRFRPSLSGEIALRICFFLNRY